MSKSKNKDKNKTQSSDTNYITIEELYSHLSDETKKHLKSLKLKE